MEFDVGAGLTVSVFPLPGHPVVSAQLWFTAGAVDEGVSQVGMAHLSEHFCFPSMRIRDRELWGISNAMGEMFRPSPHPIGPMFERFFPEPTGFPECGNFFVYWSRGISIPGVLKTRRRSFWRRFAFLIRSR